MGADDIGHPHRGDEKGRPEKHHEDGAEREEPDAGLAAPQELLVFCKQGLELAALFAGDEVFFHRGG